MNRYCTSNPAMLQGPRWYVDSSTPPEDLSPQPRTAGLGIFIINFQAQPTQTIYIKAQLSGCSSVLMAEAASLALVASITQALNINSCNYLSDCQQLVHFMNNKDSTNPPNWRIQPFTKVFTNTTRLQATRIFKISRSQNTTADVLERQAPHQALNSQLTRLCTGLLCSSGPTSFRLGSCNCVLTAVCS